MRVVCEFGRRAEDLEQARLARRFDLSALPVSLSLGPVSMTHCMQQRSVPVPPPNSLEALPLAAA